MLKKLMRPLTNYLNAQFGDIHIRIDHLNQHLIDYKPQPSYPITQHWTLDSLIRDDRTAMLLGGWHAERVRAMPANTPLHETEFSVFSQTGEDGIIQFLLAHIPNTPKTFIEFGVEHYVEANTRFLLKQAYWRGLVFDGSEAAIRYIHADEISWRHDLTAIQAFITKDNINSLITEAGFFGDIGILSVDIDGNDYWVWDAITAIHPTIVICEYNATFGDQHAITIPYQTDFTRQQGHFSNLYFGASLPALCHLAETKGYDFVGCNHMGSNAFFVRRDSGHSLPPHTAKTGFMPAQFAESRDQTGTLTFLRGEKRLLQIADCLVHDVITGKTQTIREQFELSKD